MLINDLRDWRAALVLASLPRATYHDRYASRSGQREFLGRSTSIDEAPWVRQAVSRGVYLSSRL
jgi:hypothetical protein